MPRKARQKSSTGVYHVMLRGINGQTIFKDDEDFEMLINILKESKELSKYEVYAYCIMGNHIHLLMKEGIEDLGVSFRRIGAKYVYWYNSKHKRTGHLFQDRFKSEVVENDKYLLTVLRYIHQNPIKAGIVNDIAKYPWSSYNEYFGKKELCDTKFPLSLFADDKGVALELFKKFNKEETKEQCLEYEEVTRIHDIEAIEIIKDLSGVMVTTQLQDFEKEKRDKIIIEAKKEGLSIRQIERLTGISFGVIRKIQNT
ncbi:transposase [Alkaliphilus serpentinus]|uniref:Transposase n=1 Tax=Alkaliphilus serpentinus TaxID=1482731 RepID=A0A833HLN5_9FIRM|nr:transposase [Alkaliphilus serpentinus]KAB3526252.1 transposase [Alkaliphilus serpentinus]